MKCPSHMLNLSKKKYRVFLKSLSGFFNTVTRASTPAKLKGIICLFVKYADTAFWLYTAVGTLTLGSPLFVKQICLCWCYFYNYPCKHTFWSAGGHINLRPVGLGIRDPEQSAAQTYRSRLNLIKHVVIEASMLRYQVCHHSPSWHSGFEDSGGRVPPAV